MAAQGIYRAKSPVTGVEYAYLQLGDLPGEEMARTLYEALGYQPLFDQLPTKEEYEKRKAEQEYRPS